MKDSSESKKEYGRTVQSLFVADRFGCFGVMEKSFVLVCGDGKAYCGL